MPNYVINTVELTGTLEDIAKIIDLLKNKRPDNEEEEIIDFNNVIPMPESLRLVAGGYDKQYVAAYVKTLPTEERALLVQKLLNCPTSFYKNYYHKYEEAFTKELSLDVLTRMADNFKEDYKSIDPTSVEEVGKTYINNILIYGADTWYDWSCNNWGTKWGAMSSYVNENNFGFNTAWSPALPITAKLSEMYPNVTFSHEWADEDIGNNCGRYKIKAGEVIEEYLPEGDEAVLYACEIWGYDPSEYGLEEESEIDSIDEIIQEATETCEDINKEVTQENTVELDKE